MTIKLKETAPGHESVISSIYWLLLSRLPPYPKPNDFAKEFDPDTQYLMACRLLRHAIEVIEAMTPPQKYPGTLLDKSDPNRLYFLPEMAHDLHLLEHANGPQRPGRERTKNVNSLYKIPVKTRGRKSERSLADDERLLLVHEMEKKRQQSLGLPIKSARDVFERGAMDSARRTVPELTKFDVPPWLAVKKEEQIAKGMAVKMAADRKRVLERIKKRRQRMIGTKPTK